MLARSRAFDPREVTLRPIAAGDLTTLFEHQRDPEVGRMAGVPAREHAAFMAHWASILADPAKLARIILHADHIAGQIGSWSQGDQRLVGFVVGREFWGRGIATAALTQFLSLELSRPLTALVVQHNAGSLRVLQKCGFVVTGEETFNARDGRSVTEIVLTLSAA